VGIDVEQSSAAEPCLFPRVVGTVVIFHHHDVVERITAD
jgi:hypothetical protein